VRLGRACKRAERAERACRSPGRARKSNTVPLVIEKSLLRTLAGSLRVIYAENEIRRQTGPGTQDKRLNILIKALKY
jgi:hypothetical protein